MNLRDITQIYSDLTGNTVPELSFRRKFDIFFLKSARVIIDISDVILKWTSVSRIVGYKKVK